jgi:hypothetical protein
MKQIFLVFSFFFALFLVPGVEAQQLGVSQTQVDAIKNALQRSAISNNAVENVIYDGMTFEEVLQILNVKTLGILTEVENDELGVYILAFSVVGKYRIYWSTQFMHEHPVVAGYSLATEHKLRHNQLR